MSWFCGNCKQLRTDSTSEIDMVLKAAMEDLKKDLLSRLEHHLSTVLENHKKDVLVSIQRLITNTQHAHSFHPTSSLIPPSTEHISQTPLPEHINHKTTTQPSNAAKRRLIDRSPPTRNYRAALQFGTAQEESTLRTVIVPMREQRAWIFVSRLSPDTTTEEMASYVEQQLGTSDIVVYKLLAKDRDMSSVSFISFKIGIPHSLRSQALSSSIWPTHVVFREYEKRTEMTQNFWRPQISPNQPVRSHPTQPEMQQNTQITMRQETTYPDHQANTQTPNTET